MDPNQAPHFLGLNLGPKCLQSGQPTITEQTVKALEGDVARYKLKNIIATNKEQWYLT